MTTNFGLTGGTLDATAHIEAAIPRLLSQREREAFHLRTLHGEPLSAADVMNVCTQPGRLSADLN